MVKAESSKDGAAAQANPTVAMVASFSALADAFIVASQSLRTFANVASNGQDPSALAAVIAGIQASGIPFGALAIQQTPGRKGAPKTAEQEARADKKRKRAEKKAAKDPNAPKRPASAYLMYQNEVRDHFKTENPDTNYQEVLKLIGESWKTLAEEAKKVYVERAAASMEEFKVQAEGYKQDPTAAGIQAAMAATNDDEEEDEEDDEIEEAEEEIPKSPESASSSEEESSSEDEAPAPAPVKKSKKNAAPAAVPTPPAKVAKGPKAVESASKKAKKEKKKASA